MCVILIEEENIVETGETRSICIIHCLYNTFTKTDFFDLFIFLTLLKSQFELITFSFASSVTRGIK